MPEQKYRINTDCLLSKWGFSDGDMFEDLAYHLNIEPQDLLIKIIKKFMIPELEKNHSLKIREIETIHNPIRAEIVDGQRIDWYDKNDIKLNPEYIEITLKQIEELV